MRTIEYTHAFKRDFKKAKANPLHHHDVDTILSAALVSLCQDLPLPQKNRDHHLTGHWRNYCECHLKPDLLLIYKKQANKLFLVRLGSHSQLRL